MLSKVLVKKAGILGVAFGLIASPMAFAHTSIELNKDRGVGEVQDKPQSTNESGAASYSSTELNHGERDRMNSNYTPSSQHERGEHGSRAHSGNSNTYNTSDLTRDEGDSTEW
ncbi:hypothetical protein B0H98_104136 [Vreelandella songnenensis]|uniref:Uncharacterized protein n=1 Tax=Vreelandella songnenensis TaxID=1176243 RepID=A0A2T0V3U0_9GAMM|nr:hypothetical protein [Halomonas songnenensis]PRY64832.1 hypothetical protein B0H98_104136 [Halomonas songnenensis]